MIINDDCLEAMKKMEDNSIDFIVTDPPYGLRFMGKRWDYAIPDESYWREMFRILKPGGHLAAMGGSRTFHRLATKIEDSGFEIRDCLMYLYGQGFPKSHNFGCKCKGEPLPYSHEKTTESSSESSLRSLYEANISQEVNTSGKQGEVLFSSLSEQSLQECRITPRDGNEIGEESSLEGWSNIQTQQGQLPRSEVCEMSTGIYGNGAERWICDGTSSGNGKAHQSDSSTSGGSPSQGSQYAEQCHRESRAFREQSSAQDRRGQTCQTCKGIIGFEGYGTALKPAYEPIILAMKSIDGTYKQNVEKWGLGGINIDDCRVEGNAWKSHDATGLAKTKFFSEGEALIIHKKPHEKGRWPANLILDEEAGEMLDEQSGVLKSSSGNRRPNGGGKMFKGFAPMKAEFKSDSGGASRFFYCAKASSKERQGSSHPTMKPLALMRYIIKLLAPPNDPLLLDPFTGSGSTLIAARELGIRYIGIEKEAEYCEIAQRRLDSFKAKDQYEFKF